VLGGHYAIKSGKFERGIEVPVSKEDYEYLSTVTESRLVTEGNGVKVVNVNRFALRVEEPTKQEKALKDIQDAPETLSPKKPAR